MGYFVPIMDLHFMFEIQEVVTYCNVNEVAWEAWKEDWP